jgi:hypothetical protein
LQLAKRRPQSSTRQQIQQLLAQPRGTSPVALRDRALLERFEELSEALATPVCQLVLRFLASNASVSPRGSPSPRDYAVA